MSQKEFVPGCSLRTLDGKCIAKMQDRIVYSNSNCHRTLENASTNCYINRSTEDQNIAEPLYYPPETKTD